MSKIRSVATYWPLQNIVYPVVIPTSQMRFERPLISKIVCSSQSDYTTMPRSNNATCLRCSGNLSPSDQPPVLINTSTQSNLLSNFRTSRLSKGNLCEILFVSNVVRRGYVVQL